MADAIKTQGRLLPNTIRAQVLGQVVGAGVWGMSLDTLVELHPQMSRPHTSTTANKLVHDGWLFKVGGGKHSCGTVRFFGDARDAAAHEARTALEPKPERPPTKKARAMQERLDGSRAINARGAALRASNRVAAEPVITELTRRTYAETPRERYAPTGPVARVFGALPPGVYPAAASGWAAAVTGGAA